MNLVLATATIWTALIGQATTRHRMSGDWVIREAVKVPEGQFLFGRRLSDLRAATFYDRNTGRWRVDFNFHDQRAFEVIIDDASGAILSRRFTDNRRYVLGPGEVAALVRNDPDIGPYCRHDVRLVPRFQVLQRRWYVELLDDDGLLGKVYIYRGRVVASSGPWHGFEGNWTRHLWRAVRPGLGGRWVLYLMAVLFAGLCLDLGQPLSLRTLDVAALLLLLPAGLVVPAMPVVGYSVLWGTTAYFFVRALGRGFRRDAAAASTAERDGRWGQRVSAGLLAAAVVVVLALQAFHATRTDTGGADDGGLVGGQQFFETGRMPYGNITSDFGTYGPLHYILYGAAAQVFDIGVRWDEHDLETGLPEWGRAGGRILVFLFHVLTVVALIGVGKKHAGSVRLGLLLALAYLFLPQTVDKLTHGSRIMPGTYIILALWAWPNPYLSALAIGLGAAQWWFPLVLVPMWLMSFRRWGKLKFAAVIVVVAAAALVLVMRPPAGKSLSDQWRTVRASTVRPQERFYGFMKYHPTDGFWSHLSEANRFWGKARVGVMVGYGALCLLLAGVPWRKSARRMAALTAAVIVGTQLWKNLHSAEYVGWYAPILLTALFGALGGGKKPEARRRKPEDGRRHTDSGDLNV